MGLSGSVEHVFGSNATVDEDSSGTIANIIGDNNTVVLVAGSGVGIAGSNETVSGSNATVDIDGSSTSANVTGNGNTVNLASGSDTAISGTGDTVNSSNNVSINVSGGSDTINLASSGDSLSLLGGTAYVVNNDNTGDQVDLTDTTSAKVGLTGGTLGASEIDAVYNAVLDRDVTPTELASAEAFLAKGGTLQGLNLQAQLANSAEAKADMASTCAAVGHAAPTQAQFNAFADAMSTSYGAPIELLSVDPGNGVVPVVGQQTELADTSITNLLAELPVLETEANGVNLQLQLADGTQVQFASTAVLTTFLYSLAVQQMQATCLSPTTTTLILNG